ncbi:MAG: hypothetical protein KGK07_05780 [Chloroflexota bacterium]|nr:hypothetical protein [Chloroflexota bacterium]
MRIWKVIASLVVVGVLASAAFASAAMLNINPGGLQAGNALIRGCQGDVPVNVTYGTHYNNVIGFMAVDTVTVSGIDPACISPAGAPAHTIQVVLTFGPPAICAPVCSQDLGTVPITASPVVYSIPPALQPSATNLTDVHVVIK